MYRLDPRNSVGGFVVGSKNFYPNTKNGAGVSFQDTNQLTGGVLWEHLCERIKVATSTKLFYGSEIPRAAGFAFVGRHFVGGEAYMRWEYSHKMAPFAFLRYQHSDHGGAYPGFLERRRDDAWMLSAGFERKLSKAWVLAPNYMYQANRSNTSVYRYKKHVLTIGLNFTSDLF